jgi:hypothetical protein
VLTADEEGRAFERRNHVQLQVHQALGRFESVGELFADLLAVHEQQFPEHDWSPFRSIDVDEDLRDRVRPPAGGSLIVGLVDREQADLFVASTPSTAASPFVEWPGRSSIEPVGSRVAARLGEACFRGARAPRHDGGTLLVGWAAKVIALLLARVPGSRDVFVGHHQTTPLWIGRLDEGGFVATPPSIATARLRRERALRLRRPLDGRPSGRHERAHRDGARRDRARAAPPRRSKMGDPHER